MPLIAEYIKCTNNVKDNLVPHKRITLCNLSKKLLLCIHTMQPRQETFVLHHDHTIYEPREDWNFSTKFLCKTNFV